MLRGPENIAMRIIQSFPDSLHIAGFTRTFAEFHTKCKAEKGETLMKHKFALLAILAAAAFAAGQANAAGYLKLGDIKGESTDAKHKDWILIQSVSQSITRASAGGGRATGATRALSSLPGSQGGKAFDEIIFHVRKDSGEAHLDYLKITMAKALQANRVLPRATVEFVNDETGAVYYRAVLSNVSVARSLAGRGARSSGVPAEEFALNYEEIKVTYDSAQASKKGGNVEVEWKVEEGE